MYLDKFTFAYNFNVKIIVKILNSVVSHVYYSISESEMPGMGGASGAGSGSGQGSASISKYQINMVLNMVT